MKVLQCLGTSGSENKMNIIETYIQQRVSEFTEVENNFHGYFFTYLN